MNSPEEPLVGGNVSGGVVRVGDTVRRPAGVWTPAVNALLAHLHSVGFRGAPRLWREGHGEAWLADTGYIGANEALWSRALLG